MAFGIQHVHASVANWRLLFIIEVIPNCCESVDVGPNGDTSQGIPSVLMGSIALFFLPDRPDMTKFLDEDERRIAMARMNRGVSGDKGLVVNRCKQIYGRTGSSQD